MTAPLPTPRLPLAARFVDALRRYYIRLAPAHIATRENQLAAARRRNQLLKGGMS